MCYLLSGMVFVMIISAAKRPTLSPPHTLYFGMVFAGFNSTNKRPSSYKNRGVFYICPCHLVKTLFLIWNGFFMDSSSQKRPSFSRIIATAGYFSSVINSWVQRIQLMTRVEDENTSAWTRNIVTSTGTIQINKYEYMDEEHSDEYMDDTI
jgi:hypothetical protein